MKVEYEHQAMRAIATRNKILEEKCIGLERQNIYLRGVLREAKSFCSRANDFEAHLLNLKNAITKVESLK